MPSKIIKVCASTAALGLLALAGGAMAQSGVQYSIVTDSSGNIVGQLSGDGVTLDSTNISGQQVTIACANAGDLYTVQNACGSSAVKSVVASSGHVGAAAQTPGIACASPSVATSINGQWSCHAPPSVSLASMCPAGTKFMPGHGCIPLPGN
jgi:hypothetical protein